MMKRYPLRLDEVSMKKLKYIAEMCIRDSIWDFLHILPLYQSSLCWVLPAALGGALGAALSLMRRKRA